MMMIKAPNSVSELDDHRVKEVFVLVFAQLSVNRICNFLSHVLSFSVPPPVLGKIRSAVGSAQLLMSQKFQQFYWLCQQNLVSCISLYVLKCTFFI